jgi:hypothetical protein
VNIEFNIVRLEQDRTSPREVVGDAGAPIVWNDLFSGDKDARGGFLRVVAEKGARTFADKGNVSLFRR